MIVDENNPPPFRAAGSDHWERGLDPWHASAFVGTPAEGRFEDTGPRRSGWAAIDFAGNVVGWIPDGTEVLE
jgi:hypothetical protein